MHVGRTSKLLLGGMLGLPMAAALVLPASTSGAATPSAKAAPTVVSNAQPTTTPTFPDSNIVSGGKYKPPSLKGVLWDNVSGCSSTSASFQIVNNTFKTQQVTFNGAAFGSALQKGWTLYVCFPGGGKSGHKAGVETFGLQSNSSALLTVHFK
jgi:hypothetical protein